MRLGVLYSSGKDSNYALYLMQKQGHEIACLITIKSNNPDSFMFHTPNIEMTKLQSRAMNIPLLEQVTSGEEGHELRDLEKALKRAKEDYKIEGIVTGALFSDYQRTRIEDSCKKLGLQAFSPLWHKDQEAVMREIINEGFEFIITKIAADGLDESWLGKIITQEDVDKLVRLNKKVGFNIAFEGGEAESLVVNAPMFKYKIIIKRARNSMENDYTGVYSITQAEIAEKQSL
ncbi:diphthine--ammonia ligase [Candidatus Woesearchaeota archaeon]|nr:diphthine--ammonia ligase [Candidatus Woesearchaeota archaeon]